MWSCSPIRRAVYGDPMMTRWRLIPRVEDASNLECVRIGSMELGSGGMGSKVNRLYCTSGGSRDVIPGNISGVSGLLDGEEIGTFRSRLWDPRLKLWCCTAAAPGQGDSRCRRGQSSAREGVYYRWVLRSRRRFVVEMRWSLSARTGRNWQGLSATEERSGEGKRSQE
jgi:hypothetical protein